MRTLNFKISNNKEKAVKILESKGYIQIGTDKRNPNGLCILVSRKQYFEIDDLSHAIRTI